MLPPIDILQFTSCYRPRTMSYGRSGSGLLTGNPIGGFNSNTHNVTFPRPLMQRGMYAEQVHFRQIFKSPTGIVSSSGYQSLLYCADPSVYMHGHQDMIAHHDQLSKSENRSFVAQLLPRDGDVGSERGFLIQSCRSASLCTGGMDPNLTTPSMMIPH
jgi:hypothetical protein